MPDSLELDQHCIATSKKLGDILCILQGCDWVDLSSGCGGSSLCLNRIKSRLTVFPISKTRLLRTLGVKTGNFSTDRTGHLRAVDLLFSHVNDYTRKESILLARLTTQHQLTFLVNPRFYKCDKD